MMYELSRVANGFIVQRNPLGKSDDIEALKDFAHDELTDSGSHEWIGEWRIFKGEWHRSWRTFSGRHGGSYQIREINKS